MRTRNTKMIFYAIQSLARTGIRNIVNNFYIKQGTMTYEILKGFWGDCGESFDSLLKASKKIVKTKRK